MALSYDVDNFKSLFKDSFRPNRYNVILNFPSYVRSPNPGLVTVSAKTLSIPPAEIGEVRIPVRGREHVFAGDRTYPDLEITFLNNIDFTIYQAFRSWHQGLNAERSNTGLIIPAQYQTDLVIQALSRESDTRVVWETKVIRAFPKMVQQIDLSYDTQNTGSEFTVTFAYDRINDRVTV